MSLPRAAANRAWRESPTCGARGVQFDFTLHHIGMRDADEKFTHCSGLRPREIPEKLSRATTVLFLQSRMQCELFPRFFNHELAPVPQVAVERQRDLEILCRPQLDETKTFAIAVKFARHGANLAITREQLEQGVLVARGRQPGDEDPRKRVHAYHSIAAHVALVPGLVMQQIWPPGTTG